MPVTRIAPIAALALAGLSLGGLAPSAQPRVSVGATPRAPHLHVRPN